MRAFIRRPEQAAALRDCGVSEVLSGDLLNRLDVERALREAGTVYLIAPNMHRQEVQIAATVLGAARQAAVERVVYHSVLHPQTRAMSHHWQKLRVEEALFECGLDFTILQPSAYMQNLLPYWNEIVEAQIYRVPYGEGAKLSLVDLEDVAEAAATILTQGAHLGATYELAGPQALSPVDIASALSTRLGSRIEPAEIPLANWEAAARAEGLDDYRRDTLLAMFGYYDRYGLVGNCTVLESLLGRPATRLEEFLERIA